MSRENCPFVTLPAFIFITSSFDSFVCAITYNIGHYLKVAFFFKWSHSLPSKPIVMIIEDEYSFLFVVYNPMTPDAYPTQEILVTMLLASYWDVSEAAHATEKKKIGI